MKEIIVTLLVVATLVLSVFYFAEYKNQDKQHIKVQRVGCHQYRINEFTNEVQHLEGCNSVEHLNEAE